MFLIPIKFEEVAGIPKVKSWIDNLKNLSFAEYENPDFDKINVSCSFGYFVPKGSNTEEKIIELYEMTSKMKFEDRLNYELSKVRVNILLSYKNFAISDKMSKGIIPKGIYDIVKELTKVKMTIECEDHGNEDVRSSIPEVDKSIVNFELFKDVAKSELKSNFDIDNILDKISEAGLDSLSDEERDFLDKKSKE